MIDSSFAGTEAEAGTTWPSTLSTGSAALASNDDVVGMFKRKRKYERGWIDLVIHLLDDVVGMIWRDRN